MPQNDPQNSCDEYKVGQSVRGKVVHLARFGAFVDLPGGVVGLIELPQLTTDKTVSPSDLLSIGDEVVAQVLGFRKREQQVALSLIRIGSQ